MMLPSHLLVTLLACALVSTVRPLAPREWMLALAFGVVIDVDHLLQFPRYVATHGGLGALTPATILHWGGAWQGFMHTAWGLALVIPACLYFVSATPLLAWLGHLVLDFVVARHYVRFGGAAEWAIDAALLAILAALVLRDHRLHGAGGALRDHVLARVAMVWTRG